MKSGCGFYIAQNVSCEPRTDLDSQYNDEFNEFQAKWIEIINRKGKNTIVGVIYRHPRKSDTQFQIYLKETLNKIRNENKLLTVVGDFNHNLLNHETDTQVDDFIQIMLSNFCQPHIIQPTRIVDNAKPSLVDNTFFNSIEYETKSGNITFKISDHMPNFIVLEKLDFRATKAIKIQRRDFTNFNPQKFIVDIKGLDLSNTLKQQNNVNQSCDVFHDLFIKVINNHAPVKTLSKKEIKMQKRPWISNGILKSITKRNKYYSNFMRTNDSLWYHRYKMYRDKINHLIWRSKRNYFHKYFHKFRLNSKKTWTGIKEIVNKTRKCWFKHKPKNKWKDGHRLKASGK